MAAIQPTNHLRMPGQPLVDRAGGVKVIARRLGCDEKLPYRWVKEGIEFWQAEKIAVRLGWTPEQIWPQWLFIEDPTLEPGPQQEEMAL